MTDEKTGNDISSVDWVGTEEAEALPAMCEIRFDCLVRMYDMGTRPPSSLLPLRMRMETPRSPQWFRNTQIISLEAIKNGDEYTLGRMIKDQFRQLELHIKKYESNK